MHSFAVYIHNIAVHINGRAVNYRNQSLLGIPVWMEKRPDLDGF